jgi:hypothetical protein
MNNNLPRTVAHGQNLPGGDRIVPPHHAPTQLANYSVNLCLSAKLSLYFLRTSLRHFEGVQRRNVPKFNPWRPGQGIDSRKILRKI